MQKLAYSLKAKAQSNADGQNLVPRKTTISIEDLKNNFQDLPSHISLLSIFVLNLIRYGKLLFPASSRPTPSLLLPLCWVVGLLLVLPYLPNIRHYHLQATGPMFIGGQLCLIDEEERRGRMLRGTFILL